MKKLLLSGLIIYSCSLTAQDWHPVKPSGIYHYANGTTSFATHAVFTDSIRSDSLRTIYYLNKIAVQCDTCSWLEEFLVINKKMPPHGIGNIMIIDGHQFLQKKVEVYKNGDIILRSPGKYFLKIHAKAGETWMFDSTTNRLARVVDRSIMEILGEKDSVITFHLSGNNFIVLSKNHGIIRFPDLENTGVYNLIGIEGNSKGYNMPRVRQINDLSVGDMFRYKSSDGAASWSRSEELQYEITGKKFKDDSVLYETKGALFVRYQDYEHPYLNESYDEPYEEVIGYSLNEIPELWNYEADKLYNGQIIYNYDSTQVLRVFFVENGNNEPVIRVSGLNDENNWRSGYYYPFTDFNELTNIYGKVFIPILKYGMEEVYYDYQVNLGLTGLRYTIGEGYARKTLVGYRKDGVVHGYINAMEKDINPVDLSIYPNPVQDDLNINLSENVRNLSVELYSLNGQKVCSEYYQHTGGRISLDMSYLSTGIYLLNIKTSRDYKMYRIVRN